MKPRALKWKLRMRKFWRKWRLCRLVVVLETVLEQVLVGPRSVLVQGLALTTALVLALVLPLARFPPFVERRHVERMKQWVRRVGSRSWERR